MVRRWLVQLSLAVSVALSGAIVGLHGPSVASARPARTARPAAKLAGAERGTPLGTRRLTAQQSRRLRIGDKRQPEISRALRSRGQSAHLGRKWQAQKDRTLDALRAARPDVAPAEMAHGFDRYRAVIERVRASETRAPGAVRVREIGRSHGLAIVRVDITSKAPTTGWRPRVLVVGGVHAGTERVGSEVATALIEAATTDARLQDEFDITVVPLLNPTGMVLGSRENAANLDINRSFARGAWTAESRALRDLTRGEHFDLVIDLHAAGSPGRDGFFMISGTEDGGMANRALRAMSTSALIDAAPPAGAETAAVGPYAFSSIGRAHSDTGGTLKSFMVGRGARYSYTLEAPTRMEPTRQVRGLMRLVRSTLDNVHRYGRPPPASVTPRRPGGLAQ